MKPCVSIGPVLVAVILAFTGVAMAAAPPFDILQRLAALEATVQALRTRVTALETDLATVKSSQVMALNPYLTVTTDARGPLVWFSGVNLQIVNGTGQTYGTPNGVGNLLIGYDTLRPETSPLAAPECSIGPPTGQTECEAAGGRWAVNFKSGSHNLVVGDENNYSQTGSVVFGIENTANYEVTSVLGGIRNIASGPFAAVLGGNENKASGASSTVSAGQGNVASGYASTVSGGFFNTASGHVSGSSVSGGQHNTASGVAASVSGGDHNTAAGFGASVSGGFGNTANGGYASVSGGYQRSTAGDYDWVAGELFQDQ